MQTTHMDVKAFPTECLGSRLMKRDDFLGPILPLLNWAVFLETAGEVVKIGLSLKSNHQKQI